MYYILARNFFHKTTLLALLATLFCAPATPHETCAVFVSTHISVWERTVITLPLSARTALPVGLPQAELRLHRVDHESGHGAHDSLQQWHALLRSPPGYPSQSFARAIDMAAVACTHLTRGRHPRPPPSIFLAA